MHKTLGAHALAILATTAVAAAPTPSTAQTQAQFDRINYVVGAAMSFAMCEKLGFTVSGDVPSEVQSRLQRETGLTEATIKQLSDDASRRHLKMLKTDGEAVTQRGDEPWWPGRIREYYIGHARACEGASKDPIFAGILTPPPNFEAVRGATAASDELLATGGLASWQTPVIQARGDLLMVAGACRSRIGAARSDELFARYARTDDARTRAYFVKQFEDGLDDPEFTQFDRTQCERAIRSFTAKAARDR